MGEAVLAVVFDGVVDGDIGGVGLGHDLGLGEGLSVEVSARRRMLHRFRMVFGVLFESNVVRIIWRSWGVSLTMYFLTLIIPNNG